MKWGSRSRSRRGVGVVVGIGVEVCKWEQEWIAGIVVGSKNRSTPGVRIGPYLAFQDTPSVSRRTALRALALLEEEQEEERGRLKQEQRRKEQEQRRKEHEQRRKQRSRGRGGKKEEDWSPSQVRNRRS